MLDDAAPSWNPMADPTANIPAAVDTNFVSSNTYRDGKGDSLLNRRVDDILLPRTQRGRPTGNLDGQALKKLGGDNVDGLPLRPSAAMDDDLDGLPLKKSNTIDDLDGLPLKKSNMQDDLDGLPLKKSNMQDDLDGLPLKKSNTIDDLDGLPLKKSNTIDDLDGLPLKKSNTIDDLDGLPLKVPNIATKAPKNQPSSSTNSRRDRCILLTVTIIAFHP